MNIKTALKERLLEIPINSRSNREKYRLANDLNINLEDIEPLLSELVKKDILKEKNPIYLFYLWRYDNYG